MNPCHPCKIKGMCCHFSYLDRGIKKIHPTYHCRFLNEKKECSIFEKRFLLNPECKTIEWMIVNDGLLSSCEYKFDWKIKDVRIVYGKFADRLWDKIKNKWKKEGHIPFSVSDKLRYKITGEFNAEKTISNC